MAAWTALKVHMPCHIIFKKTMSLYENGTADRGILNGKPVRLIPKLE
jgi:hypothetical protein